MAPLPASSHHLIKIGLKVRDEHPDIISPTCWYMPSIYQHVGEIIAPIYQHVGEILELLEGMICRAFSLAPKTGKKFPRHVGISAFWRRFEERIEREFPRHVGISGAYTNMSGKNAVFGADIPTCRGRKVRLLGKISPTVGENKSDCWGKNLLLGAL
jgi:hypothetical protein